jgi:alpha-tubulin suppressor-like RCC1 family protein
VAAQTCNGTVCLENREVANPGSDAGSGAVDGATSPDAGGSGPDLPVAQPDAAAPDVPLATSDAAYADVALAKPDAAADAPASSADSGMAGDTSGGAKPDTSPSNVCTPPCTPGQACVAGQCTACGRVAGQPCCADTPCIANLTCTATNQCACGDQNQACCGGNTCSTELACVGGKCTCGEFGSACCAGNTCNNGGICAGVRCGCVKTCGDGFYQKIDGTFGGATALRNADGTPCTQAISVSKTEVNNGYGQNTACIVRGDGTVWCQGDNSNGLLGCGNATLASSANLVQVVTGVGGPPLTGINEVVLGLYSRHACALGTDGGVWCWGGGAFGELGTGIKAGSSFAVPVLVSAGGARFVDAVKVGVGSGYGAQYYYTCALKKDGSVWCWGGNEMGTLGINAANLATVASPTKISALIDPVSVLSVGYAKACAIDSSGWTWCWGYDVGPDGSTNNLLPVRMVMAKNGAAFAGAIQIDPTNARIRKSDGSLWDWNATAVVPEQEKGTAVAGTYWLGNFCWIGADGILRASAYSLVQPTCP